VGELGLSAGDHFGTTGKDITQKTVIVTPVRSVILLLFTGFSLILHSLREADSHGVELSRVKVNLI